jgi:iron complex outermembrane receptor protein
MMKSVLFASAALLVPFTTSNLAAQEARPAPVTGVAAADDGEGETQIVVTGSRIAKRDYDSASPIITLDRQLLERSSAITVDAFLQSLPQVGSSFGATNSNAGNGGASNANLHYLGSNRTLVLLEGRRAIPGDAVGALDLNMVPAGLVSSVEIITGGASAVYGSDAVAGVINFKLNTELTGLHLNATGGISSRSDAEQAGVEAIYGWRPKGGRGGFVLYGGYAHRSPALTNDRPNQSRQIQVNFDAQGNPLLVDQVNNALREGAYIPSATNLPSQASINAVFSGYGVAADAIGRGNVLGFNNDGSLFANNPLTNYRGGTVSNPYYHSFNQDFFVQVPSNRYYLGLLGDYEFSSAAQIYARFYYVHSDVTRQIAPFELTTQVPLTNPFVPTALRSILATRPNPNAPVTISRSLGEIGPRTLRYDSDLYQGVIGLKGEIGGGWRYDAFVSHGRLDRTETGGGAFRVAQLTQLVTAADGGASLCAGGFNPFGLGKISQQCVDFISYNPLASTSARQTVLEGTATGPLFTLPAGQVMLAVGANYREEKYQTTADALFAAGGAVGGLRPAGGIIGRYDVKEAFGEVSIPLLADTPLAHKLEASLGYRISDYSQSGSNSTYKAELVYAPIEALRFRGSYQRAVRAPNMNEFAAPGLLVNLSVTQDPCSANSTFRTGGVPGVDAARVRTLCLAQGVPAASIDSFIGTNTAANTATSRGNPNLAPETADTFTVGTVLRTRLGGLGDLSASLDYYQIDLSNTIAQVGFNDNIVRCYNQFGLNPNYEATSSFCDGFARTAAGNLTGGLLTFSNIGQTKLAGIDGQINWRTELDKSGKTVFNLNFIGSYLARAKIQALAGAPFSNVRGTIGSIGQAYPEWRHSLWAQLTHGDFDVGLRWRYTSPMASSNIILAPTLPALGSPSISYFDLDAGVRFFERYSLRIGVENLGDRQPPVLSRGSGANTEGGTFDLIGRRYFVRLGARF